MANLEQGTISQEQCTQTENMLGTYPLNDYEKNILRELAQIKRLVIPGEVQQQPLVLNPSQLYDPPPPYNPSVIPPFVVVTPCTSVRPTRTGGHKSSWGHQSNNHESNYPSVDGTSYPSNDGRIGFVDSTTVNLLIEPHGALFFDRSLRWGSIFRLPNSEFRFYEIFSEVTQ